MTSPVKIHVFLFVINFIYSLNYILIKYLTPEIIEPMGLQLCRVIGAALVFQTFFLLQPNKERVENKDLLLLASCALFGVACNGLFFLKGIALTTPINASLIIILTPLLVMILSYLFLKEKIKPIQIVGMILGLSGAVILISKLQPVQFNSSSILGDLFIFLNACSFSIYFILARNILKKYKPLTVARWLFSFGFFFVLPFGYPQFSRIPWEAISISQWLIFIFVIIFPTCINYYLYNVALKNISPTIASSYIFSQPLITTTLALSLGAEQLKGYQVFGGFFILLGVSFVAFFKQKK